MIYCILDGDKTYPSLSSNIKITRENPDLKNKGSYTLDVTFPMSIFENRRKFRNLNRIDVSLKGNDYESATLYVGNKAVISGVGVVTSVSNTEVKMQIMDSNSEFKYASGFDKIYIDEFFNIQHSFTSYLPFNPPMISGTGYIYYMPKMIDYIPATAEHSYVGKERRAIYTPVYNETDDCILNEIVKFDDKHPLAMINPAVQYNLLHIMEVVLYNMKYEYDLSVIDKYPWNAIYVVNTGRIVPHWTVERFITEFNSLFGLAVRIENRKIIFERINYDEEPISYECLEEFTSEYDDEGVNVNETSNLKYNLYDSSEKTVHTEIPDEVMEKYPIMEFDSESQMYNSLTSIEEGERERTIFSTPTGYFYAVRKNYVNGEWTYEFIRAGQFNKLVRDPESDDAKELCIVPVTMACRTFKFRKIKLITHGDFIETEEEVDINMAIPSAEKNEYSTYNEYDTVQESLENGVSFSSLSESERMEVFFLSEHTKSFYLLDVGVTTSVVGTDPTIDAEFRDQVSFALDKTPEGVVHVGQLHTETRRINGKNQRCIKFISDDIPDPTRIYIFRNKRYVCEKIEIQITEKGIDPVKTGYFYEIVS